MRLSTLFGVAITTLFASFASANAQERIQIGVLECDGGQNVGFVVGSVTSLQCVFQGEGRRSEAYVANVRRFGVDLGFTQQTKFSWAAYGPTDQIGHGGLAGHYGGVGANASVGVGFGGNFLLGGAGNAYVLQPVSVQGQTGLNVAAGVADIELEPVAVAVRGGYRRHPYHRIHRHYRHHR
jgi:Protein of unknown function (DUF992)